MYSEHVCFYFIMGDIYNYLCTLYRELNELTSHSKLVMEIFHAGI